MTKRKTNKENQSKANSKQPAKVPVTIRVKTDILSDIDRMAELRGSTRAAMVAEAFQFYVWMSRGGFAVQHFEPWADPTLKNSEGVVDRSQVSPPLRRQPSLIAEVDDEAAEMREGASGSPGISAASSEVRAEEARRVA